MTKTIEYRVRAVTRYVVTHHESGKTQEIGEYTAPELASGAAAALAAFRRQHEDGKEAVFVPYDGPPPGKVMRCKVTLHTRIPQWGVNVDAAGGYLGRTIEQAGYGGSTYKAPDPTDPANVKPDGERLMFAAVCKGFDKDGVAEVEENRIFGYWSPTFTIDGHVRNQTVLDSLEQGREYYVDFTPAPKAA